LQLTPAVAGAKNFNASRLAAAELPSRSAVSGEPVTQLSVTAQCSCLVKALSLRRCCLLLFARSLAEHHRIQKS